MKRPLIPIIAAFACGAVVAGALVWVAVPRHTQPAAPAAADAAAERKPLYWTDPMIPGFKSDKPGKSPMGMDMIPVYEDEAAGGGATVTLRPEIVQNLGVRTQPVTRGAPPRRLVTTGYIFRDGRGLAALVDLFDSEAGAVRPGQVAEVRISDSATVYHGVVESIESDIDIGARALKARIRMTHAGIVLRPNMLAEVTIFARGAGKQALYIPREALIRTGTRNAVVVALGAGRFRPVEVVPGVESGDWVEIVRGLKAGDNVVTSGQFLIDSEANVRASFERMEAVPPADAGDGAAAPSPAAPAGPHSGH